MTEVRVRELEPGEWTLWRELRLRSLADAPDAFGRTHAEVSDLADADWELRVARTAADSDAAIWVAFAGEDAVGVATTRLGPAYPRTANLYAMWVDPRARGTGVGRALLERAVGWARAAGATAVELAVTDGNAAGAALYRSAGFADTGRRELLREGSTLETIVLRKDLGGPQGFTTRALRTPIHLGDAEPVSVPIFETSTFAFPDAEALAETIRAGKDAGHVYTRWHNPARGALEDAMARLEGGEAAVSFSSGMAAITTVLTALLRAGDHAVFSSDLYGGTHSVARDLLPRWGVDVTVAASHRASVVAAALREDTVVCYAETIGNPTVSVPDLRAIADACHERGTTLVVDNTFASPYLCNPIAFGAHVVVHSTTKYVGGHHDLTGGVAVGDADTMRGVRDMSSDLGGTPSPFDCWLALRGLATLALRMERHCATALDLARMLEAHDAVARVHYPGLPSHADHDVASRVLHGFSGMLAFEAAGGLEAGRRFVESVRIAKMAASLGGVHTLVIHPATVTHTQLTPEQRLAAGITDGLVRVSVGIEDAADVLEDFLQALG